MVPNAAELSTKKQYGYAVSFPLSSSSQTHQISEGPLLFQTWVTRRMRIADSPLHGACLMGEHRRLRVVEQRVITFIARPPFHCNGGMRRCIVIVSGGTSKDHEYKAGQLGMPPQFWSAARAKVAMAYSGGVCCGYVSPSCRRAFFP